MEKVNDGSTDVAPVESGTNVTIRVVVAEDHAVMRHIIEKILRRDQRIEIVGTATDGREALQVIRDAASDVVLMDLAMPEMDGVEVLRRLQELSIDTAVVIVSVHAQTEAVVRALEEGARGYVTKMTMTSDLLPAVHAAMAGETYVSDSLQPLSDNRSA